MPHPILGPDAGWLTIGLLIVLKVTGVLLLAWMALLAMQRASASTRHLVIALAFFASLAVPVLALILPAWEVVPPAFGWSALIGDSTARRATAEGRHESRRGQDPSRLDPSWLDPSRLDSSLGVDASTATSGNPAPRPVAAAAPGFWRPQSILLSLALAWTIISGGLVVLLLAQMLATTRERRRAIPITSDDWLSLLTETRRHLGVRSTVELRRRASRAMPLVWGWINPTILLPRDCDEWTIERRRAVLAHELGHVARRDIPVALVSHLACAIHWFNPLAWSLKRRLTLERELACDRLVVDHGVQSASYANHLLETAMAYRESASLTPASLTPVMAARSQLEGRIMAILDSDRNQSTPSRALQGLLAVLLVFALVPLASLAFATPIPAEPTPTGRVSISDTANFKAELRRLGLRVSDVDELLEGLESSSALTRGASAWALGRAGDPRAVEPLARALSDRDATVRQWAARSLGALGDTRAVWPLLDQLDDPDPEAREWIVRTLGDLGDPRAVEPLIDRLNDPEAEVREWIVRTLASVGDERTVQPLVDRLDYEEEAEVREWIVRTLASVGDERTLQPLIARLDDEDAEVREWAARALGNVDRSSDNDSWRRRVPEPLMPGLGDAPPTPGDPQVIAALIRSLGNDDLEVREWSARSLGNMGDGSAVAPLVDLLGDPDDEVREWAIRSLGSLRDRQAMDGLLGALGDANPEIREWAVRSLGLMQDARTLEPLTDRLVDESAVVREWAVRALGASGDPRAIEALSRLRGDEDPEVRRWVEHALQKSAAPRS